MKKTNTYWKTAFQRRNVIQDAILDLFLAFSSWPRMILEVPIRRNMGQRYFRLSTAIWLVFLLCILPPIIFGNSPYAYRDNKLVHFLIMFTSWYAYVGYFAYCAWQRHQEIKMLPGTYDFQRYSLSTGDIHERFQHFEFNGRRLSRKQIETLLEPGFFFFTGIALGLFNQPIGGVFHLCSLFYAFSYRAQYRRGEDALLDKIDEKIVNEDTAKFYSEEDEVATTRGVPMYGHRPADPRARRRVAELFSETEESAVAF